MQWSGPSVVNTRIAELQNEGWKASFNVTFDELSQADQIQQTALGQYDVTQWRQFGAADPWTDDVWIMCKTVGGISLNWPRVCDPARDALLAAGRAETDPAKRAKVYQDLSAESARRVHLHLLHPHVVGELLRRGRPRHVRPDLTGGCRAPLRRLGSDLLQLGLDGELARHDE